MYRQYQLLTGFTGKLHFVSEVVKKRYWWFCKDFTHCLFQFNKKFYKEQTFQQNKMKLRTPKSRNLKPFFINYLPVKIREKKKHHEILSRQNRKIMYNIKVDIWA